MDRVTLRIRALALQVSGWALGSMFFVALAGCSINVSEVTLSEEATSLGLYAEDRNPKRVFAVTDKQVTLHVRFDYNVVASTQNFLVTWTEPNGQAYVGGPVRTVFGSNTSLIVSMKLAGTRAAKKPGIWRVTVRHDDQLMVTEEFEIR
jgi:uncharacterized protein (DUF58 family)